MVAGRHAASGDFREIRRLMTERPHQYTIRSDDDRRLAAAVMAEPSVSAVQLAPMRARPHRRRRLFRCAARPGH
jgi:ABC-2 type transport system ATP-binding protein